MSTAGKVAGTSTATCSVGPAMEPSVAATTSSTSVGWRLALSAPAWMRLMSRRFPTRWLSRSAAESIVCANAWTCTVSHLTSVWSRLVAEALMDASGVRRSWLTACRRAVRSWSPSARWVARAASA